MRILALLFPFLATTLAKDYKIDVAPGAGERQIKNKADKYPCRFFYSAQGGTNEEWTMSINKIANSDNYSCKVFRPSADSYLFFESVKIKGCKLCNILSWTALDNDGVLGSSKTDSAIFSTHKNFILNTENFKNELVSIEIIVEWPKEEL